MNSKSASVLVIESHPLMREALLAAIIGEPGLELTSQPEYDVEEFNLEIPTQNDVIQLSSKPDIVLLDLDSPEMAEMETIKLLRKSLPDTAILALTSSETAGENQAALDAGAQLVLSKTEPKKALLRALHSLKTYRFDDQKTAFDNPMDDHFSGSESSLPQCK